MTALPSFAQEVGARKISSLKTARSHERSLEVGPEEAASVRLGCREFGPTEIGAVENRVRQSRGTQVCAAQPCRSQVLALKKRSVQVQALKVSTYECITFHVYVVARFTADDDHDAVLNRRTPGNGSASGTTVTSCGRPPNHSCTGGSFSTIGPAIYR